jgi:hypothetical protein
VKYFYYAFGLLIEANGLIPGLLLIEYIEKTEVDVHIHLLEHSFTQLPDGNRVLIYTSENIGLLNRPILQVWAIDDRKLFRFRYDDETEFVIDNQGRHVWASWPSTLSIDDTAPFITGPILGFVLRRRLNVCLHSSAIIVDDQNAFAIVGPAGSGKSSLAAAFAKKGYYVLADDITALKSTESGYLVMPSHPHIRLWEPTVFALFGSSSALPRIAPNDPYWTKQYLQLGTPEHPFTIQPAHLAAIYLLDKAVDTTNTTQITACSKLEGLLFLTSNTYMNYLLDTAARAHEFDFLTKMIGRIPLRWFRFPRMLDILMENAESLINDFYRMIREPDKSA